VPAGILVALAYAGSRGYTSEEQDGVPVREPAVAASTRHRSPAPLGRPQIRLGAGT
jgi:hypothetical protein